MTVLKTNICCFQQILNVQPERSPVFKKIFLCNCNCILRYHGYFVAKAGKISTHLTCLLYLSQCHILNLSQHHILNLSQHCILNLSQYHILNLLQCQIFKLFQHHNKEQSTHLAPHSAMTKPAAKVTSRCKTLETSDLSASLDCIGLIR